MKNSSFILFFILLICSCTHKSYKKPVVEIPDCDTTVVTYHADVQPLLSANCYSCHATAVTQSGGLDLEDFTSLKAYLQNGFRGDGIYGSKLYNCILHTPLAQQMPPTYKLDTCSIMKIKRWIDLGGSNN